jgi:serine/threonine-protein kinase
MLVLQPGHRLDRFELLRQIGEGGAAQLWLVRGTGKRLERLFTMKVVARESAPDTHFLDVARVAAGIDHPNVARIFELGEAGGALFVVMEYVPGDRLERLTRALARVNVPLPAGIAARIVADACSGMHAAHELRGERGALRGIVHGAISPQNILLGESGVAKLIDFGTSGGKAKSRYTAPEQALGVAVDRRVDVFAAGAVLYTLLAQCPPFDPPPPLPESVPRGIAAVVAQALAKKPADRFPSGAEMRNALEDALHVARLRVTTEDVGRFYEQHLEGRIHARRTAVEEALQRATQRALMAERGTSRAGEESAANAGRAASPPRHPGERLAAAVAKAFPPAPETPRFVEMPIAAVGPPSAVMSSVPSVPSTTPSPGETNRGSAPPALEKKLTAWAAAGAVVMVAIVVAAWHSGRTAVVRGGAGAVTTVMGGTVAAKPVAPQVRAGTQTGADARAREAADAGAATRPTP